MKEEGTRGRQVLNLLFLLASFTEHQSTHIITCINTASTSHQPGIISHIIIRQFHSNGNLELHTTSHSRYAPYCSIGAEEFMLTLASVFVLCKVQVQILRLNGTSPFTISTCANPHWTPTTTPSLTTRQRRHLIGTFSTRAVLVLFLLG